MQRYAIGICTALALAAAPSFAGPMRGHPNLKAAHNAVKNAIGRISAAQAANEFDMNGHAQKAKELLEQAEGELRQAAEAANEHR